MNVRGALPHVPPGRPHRSLPRAPGRASAHYVNDELHICPKHTDDPLIKAILERAEKQAEERQGRALVPMG